MSGINEPKLQSITQLFSGNTRYIVPRYQRNFAWKSDEIEELWEDIVYAIDTRDYFLGTIVLQKTPAEIIQKSPVRERGHPPEYFAAGWAVNRKPNCPYPAVHPAQWVCRYSPKGAR